MTDRLKENCGNCDLLTWDKRDEKWDTGGEFKTIHPFKTKCAHPLMCGKVPVNPLMSECLFWKGGDDRESR